MTLAAGAASLLLTALLVPSTAGAADTGTVTGHLLLDGTGLDPTQFKVYVEDLRNVQVAADGSYTITNLTPGPSVMSLGSTYNTGVGSWLESIDVPSGGTVTRDIVVTKVAGKVTDQTTGAGIKNVTVRIESAPAALDSDSEVLTNSAGEYAAPVVVDGNPRAIAFFPSDTWFGRWLGSSGYVFGEQDPDGPSVPSDAARFDVTAGVTKNINIGLARPATLKGTLRLPSNATAIDRTVTLYPGLVAATSGIRILDLAPAKSGVYHFTFTGVPAGLYRVGFGRYNNAVTQLSYGPAVAPATYYRNTAETSPGKAIKITLKQGKTRTLETTQAPKVSKGGTLTGSIYKPEHGKRIGRGDLFVIAVPTDKNYSTRVAYTRADGKYTISGLSTGSYNLYVWNAYKVTSRESHGACIRTKIGSPKVTAGKTTAVKAFKYSTSNLQQLC